MNRKIAPCSFTMLFTHKKDRAQLSWINFPEPKASMIYDYKLAFQYLQLMILDGKPDNLKEIGDCFKALEKEFENFEKLFKENITAQCKKCNEIIGNWLTHQHLKMNS